MTPGASIRTVAAAALAALLAISGCATARTGAEEGDAFSDDLAERNEVEILVKNFNFADATVWVRVRDARVKRLGYVTGKTDAVFTMPWTFSAPLRLEFVRREILDVNLTATSRR